MLLLPVRTSRSKAIIPGHARGWTESTRRVSYQGLRQYLKAHRSQQLSCRFKLWYEDLILLGGIVEVNQPPQLVVSLLPHLPTPSPARQQQPVARSWVHKLYISGSPPVRIFHESCAWSHPETHRPKHAAHLPGGSAVTLLQQERRGAGGARCSAAVGGGTLEAPVHFGVHVPEGPIGHACTATRRRRPSLLAVRSRRCTLLPMHARRFLVAAFILPLVEVWMGQPGAPRVRSCRS
eukprot:scaffold2514_cov373-Prasinococcus_capsulatus_cf.AAC.12